MSETDARWVLDLAADLIERVGWTREAVEKHGRVCTLGAIYQVARQTEPDLKARDTLIADASELLRSHLGIKKETGGITLWNDQARTRVVW